MTDAELGRCRAVSRASGTAEDSAALPVDTADCAPPDMARFATMNPFHFEPGWRIPVPGTRLRASSMESVWQGLKYVDGETDLAMFDRRPVKRPPDHLRGPDFDYPATTFEYAGEALDLVTARLLIYLPAYLYVLDRLVPDAVVAEIASARAAGRDVLFYDWDDNVDILDPSSSFSHSAILAAWFDGRLAEWFLPAYRSRGSSIADLDLARYHDLHPRKG